MKSTRFLMLLMMLSLAACEFDVVVGFTPTPLATHTALLPTDTALVVPASPTGAVPATGTSVSALPTSVDAPATQVPPPTATLVPTRETEQNIKIFLIAIEDNGQSGPPVGCGDSAIPITVTIPRTQGVLRAALEALLSEKAQYYGESGLYNALYQSDLRLAGVTIEQGKAIIHLTGTLRLGGTCDAPRLAAQIEQTALQFSTVTAVEVFVNDVPLEEALSQK